MMLFVDERSGNGSWPSVEVFIGTPSSKVNIPVVNLQGNISRGMREIPAGISTNVVRDGGDCGDVHEFTGVIVDGTE